jgi:hypothetical protein
METRLAHLRVVKQFRLKLEGAVTTVKFLLMIPTTAGVACHMSNFATVCARTMSKTGVACNSKTKLPPVDT